MATTTDTIQKTNEKIEQLEEVEKLLVEKLGMTQMNQHQALANLHKVVQICNSGINMQQIQNNVRQNKGNMQSGSSIGAQYKTITEDSHNALNQGVIGM